MNKSRQFTEKEEIFMEMERKTINLNEACQVLNISKPTLLKAIKDGKIPAIRFSERRIVIPCAALDKYLAGAGNAA